jgi:hypothetical protein
MRIENHTHWNSAHIRAFVKRAAQDEMDPEHRKILVVKVVYGANRIGHTGGLGYYGDVYHRGRRARFIQVTLPSGNMTGGLAIRHRLLAKFEAEGNTLAAASLREQLAKPVIDKRVFASVLLHEMAHTRGMKHGDMRGSTKFTWAEGWEQHVLWADDLPLEKAEPKAKPNKAVEQRAKIEASVKRWRTRVKRDTTILHKWERRLRRLPLDKEWTVAV